MVASNIPPIRLMLWQYDRNTIIREETRRILPSTTKSVFSLGNSVLEAESSLDSSAGSVDLVIDWRVVSGNFPQCAFGISIEASDSSTEAYPWMAGAVYNGNRFRVRKQKYSPRYPESDTGPGAETVITDIPHLEKGEGRGFSC